MNDGARFWDDLLAAPALPWGRRASPAVERLAAQLPAGAAVLVPGCAYGRNALALAQRGFTVTAYDYAPAAIARARAEFADPRVRYLVADAADVPDGRYEGIFCHFLLHLFRVAERRRLIEALAAALVPGGLLLASGLSARCAFYG